MAFLPTKTRREKGLHNFTGYLWTNYPRPEAQHIHIIVLDALMGGIVIMA